MLTRTRLTPFDLLLYAAVVLIWGVAWIAIHFQVGVVPPDVSIMWRFLLAGVVLIAIAAARGEPLRYRLHDHLMFMLLGLLLFSFNFLFFYHAAERLPSGLLSIVFSLVSFFNVWLGALFLGAPIDRRVVAGGLLGGVGMLLMFYPQFAGHAFPAGAMLAFVFCLIGTLAFCFGNIVSALLSRRDIPILASSGYSMLYGTAAIAVYAALRGHSFALDWTAPYLVGLVYLALLGSVIAFTSYLTLVARIGADRAGYITVLGPIVALAVSTLVENLQWTMPAALGLVTVIVGNVMVLRPAGKS